MKVLLNFSKELNPETGLHENNEYINDSIYIPIGKGGIKIKKSHQGRFTDYCGGKVTDVCIQKAKNSGNASLKKQAVFAENARAWKHQKGGTLQPLDLGKFFAEYKYQAPRYYSKAQNNIPDLPETTYNIPTSSKQTEQTEEATGLWSLPVYNSTTTTEEIISSPTYNSTESSTTPSPGKRKGIYEDSEAGKRQFVKDLNAAYKKAGVINEELRKVLVAQSALESGWGAKSTGGGDYNYGNLTTGSHWAGAYRTAWDHDAQGNRVTHNFRSYNSLDDFITDKLKFIGKGSRYGVDINSDDALTYIDKIVRGGYAEDPNYRNALTSMYKSIGSRWS
jgi:flagellum-specific peptidoglycan hydrolase FlgJ